MKGRDDIMVFKRYIIEIGTGVDLHGGDVTKAARKAVKDAISKSCLCGLSEILKIENLYERIKIDVLIATSKPEVIDVKKIIQDIPFGQVQVYVVNGGLAVKGIHVDSLGEGNVIEIVNAALTVFVDVNINNSFKNYQQHEVNTK